MTLIKEDSFYFEKFFPFNDPINYFELIDLSWMIGEENPSISYFVDNLEFNIGDN